MIRIEDFPDDETLHEMECESEFDLLGLFRGIGLAQGAATLQPGSSPTWSGSTAGRSWITGPSTRRRLGHLVTHVLVHEIGHHFGLSDEDMEEIEAAAG